MYSESLARKEFLSLHNQKLPSPVLELLSNAKVLRIWFLQSRCPFTFIFLLELRFFPYMSAQSTFFPSWTWDDLRLMAYSTLNPFEVDQGSICGLESTRNSKNFPQICKKHRRETRRLSWERCHIGCAVVEVTLTSFFLFTMTTAITRVARLDFTITAQRLSSLATTKVRWKKRTNTKNLRKKNVMEM